MIQRRTVFVLGAGANVPYGFSTGAGLLDKARAEDPRELMGNAGLQISRQDSENFKAAIYANMLPSVDAMLERRPDLWRVGKRVMAALLYREEKVAGPGPLENDWMSLIFECMAEGADTLLQFTNNAVTFLTFNYDRYLEHRFIMGLIARYNIHPHTAWGALEGKVVHLHGSLGNLPEQYPPDPSRERADAVGLGAPDEPDVYRLGLALPVAETSIKIVHDQPNPEGPFRTAAQILGQAERAIFLGFGFGRQNVERLQTGVIPSGAAIYCTTYGMTDAEIGDRVAPAFPTRTIVGQTSGSPIRLALRERIGLLR